MPYSLLSKAILFAVQKHDGEYRDGEGGLPYSTHPVEVCTLLRYTGNVMDEDLLCAAALHDVLEETPTTAAEIEKEFGERISGLVSELTRIEPTAEQTEGMAKEEIWALRSGMLLDEISKMSPDAQQVKLADRLANLRQSKITRKGEKLKRYVRQTKKMLEIIPKSVNPALWRAISTELD
jgi:guanosine-3',5'-bis(diphosphate) 3'-pyrophosphohydrolase